MDDLRYCARSEKTGHGEREACLSNGRIDAHFLTCIVGALRPQTRPSCRGTPRGSFARVVVGIPRAWVGAITREGEDDTLAGRNFDF